MIAKPLDLTKPVRTRDGLNAFPTSIRPSVRAKGSDTLDGFH